MGKLWKKGRGKLGPFEPLFGSWIAQAESPMGLVRCERSLEPILGGNYLQLKAAWHFGEPGSEKVYQELALIGAGDDKQVCFWSYTSDGKRSQGTLADVSDLHPEAIGFEADMPAGRARVAYWPTEDGGFFWVVESKTKKGWNRFVIHHYHRT
ncbi:MAG: hypothetical protein ABJA02_03325 [Acidobacteriota bacterium]